MLEFELPFPPSQNHYWRRVGSRMLISRAGRAFRETVCALLAIRQVTRLTGSLLVEIEAFPPDARRRDLDNLQKALLDALQHGGAYQDDSQIDRLTIQRREIVPAGKVLVRISRFQRT